MDGPAVTPGSVPKGDDHLSRNTVASALKRSTREPERAAPNVLYLTLLQTRFT